MLLVLTVPLAFLAVSALLLLALHLEGVLTGRRRSWGRLAKQYAWCMSLLLVLILLVRRLHGRSVPDAANLSGEYRIDRASWPGPQAEWQYAHYTLEIKPAGRLLLTECYDSVGCQTFAADFTWREAYRSPRISLTPTTERRHHILANDPILYRGTFSHRYVFRSSRYGNVFFRPARWYE